jgi:hypothetical protein
MLVSNFLSRLNVKLSCSKCQHDVNQKNQINQRVNYLDRVVIQLWRVECNLKSDCKRVVDTQNDDNHIPSEYDSAANTNHEPRKGNFVETRPAGSITFLIFVIFVLRQLRLYY